MCSWRHTHTHTPSDQRVPEGLVEAEVKRAIVEGEEEEEEGWEMYLGEWTGVENPLFLNVSFLLPSSSLFASSNA